MGKLRTVLPLAVIIRDSAVQLGTGCEVSFVVWGLAGRRVGAPVELFDLLRTLPVVFNGAATATVASNEIALATPGGGEPTSDPAFDENGRCSETHGGG